MKSIFHPAVERGHANHGWLDAYHSFSFASWHNPVKMGFGALRVLNDDTIQGGQGFGKHPHQNMEIITLMLQGALEHQDSAGNKGVIKPGEVQVMSAGTGISHSEYNHSATDLANLLQIWIFPRAQNQPPRYDQKGFAYLQETNVWHPLVSPDSRPSEGSLTMGQDAWITMGVFTVGMLQPYAFNIPHANGLYAFVIEGSADVHGQHLNRRDAIGIWEADAVDFQVAPNTQLLLLEVPL